jgi:transcriptional regulator with XRE-family HTH domain
VSEPDKRLGGLGAFLRGQRQLANLSLRQVAELAHISNPYLSQLERGMHAPSLRILRSLADALGISADTLLEQAGLLADDSDSPSTADDRSTEAAIRTDPRLTSAQKQTMLSVYRNFVAANDHSVDQP